MSDRRQELERKKQKLALIREEKEKRRREKMKEKSDISDKTNSERTDLFAEADELLDSLGIPAAGVGNSEIKKSSTPEMRVSPVKEVEPNCIPKRSERLTIVNVHQTNIPPKEYVAYNKQTQTTSTGTDREGSLSSSPYKDYGHYWRSRKARPFDYYEWDDEFQVLTYGDVSVEEDLEGSSLTSRDMDTPPLYPTGHQSHKLTGLPHVEMVRPAQEAASVPATPISDEHKDQKKKICEFSDEQKKQIMMREDFQTFFDRTTRIVERALWEKIDLLADYSGTVEEQDLDDKTGIKLSLNRTFYEDRWSRNRTVTSFDWSSQFPELMVASYNNNEDSPNDPDGVCLIWNMKYKKTTPEYIFHCQSSVMSACFAKFHPNLVLGGTYSGQVVLWDNRSSKRTPVQRSPLSSLAHTHPVYCIHVVGTQNAHNLVSVSSDGKFCTWSLDMLSAPQDTMELSHQKQSRAVSVTSMSFPYGDFNNFVVGSEEGSIYTACRHGSKAGILDTFEGHQGPITAIDTHCVPGSIDFSHLFVTSSFDWTVKLWSLKDNKEIYSFENNADYVYDVAWSPIHPALFSTVDGTGRLDVWNLNNDTEVPTATMNIQGKPSLNKVTWTPSGHQVAVGDDAGLIHIYDVGEQLASPKTDEWSRFAHTLMEMDNIRTDQGITISSGLSSGNSFLSPVR